MHVSQRLLPVRTALAVVTLAALAACASGGTATSDTLATVPSSTTESPTASTAPATTEPAPVRAIDTVPVPEATTVDALLALDRPIVIVHAGGDFDAPHSTMYAFTQAALAGADVLEMDVMLTADGVLVVHHDDTVDRTTNSTGKVRDLTYDQLSALDNAYWFSGDTWSDKSLPDTAYTLRGVRTGDTPTPEGYSPDDFRVETFRSVAEAFPNHVLDIDIKIPTAADGTDDIAAGIEVARQLATEIDDLGRTDSTIVVSFDVDVIAAFRDFAPGVATSPGLATLVTWYTGGPVEFAPTDVVFQVPPVYGGLEVLTPDVLARAAADGFEVWVWMDDPSTQENSAFYADLLDRGIEGLLVSKPSLGVQAVADHLAAG